METNRFILVTISIVVIALLVGAVFTPIVSSSTTRTVQTEIENEEPDWIRFGYATTDPYSFEVSIDNDNGTATVDSQTGELYDMLVLATENVAVAIVGESIIVSDGETNTNLGTSASVVRNASGLTINGESYTPGAWSYYPNANGTYGHFAHADLNTDDKPWVAWGNFAGVFTYNDRDNPDVGLVMDATVTDGVIEGVNWAKPSEDVGDLEPIEDITIIPLDPSIITPIDLDPEPDASTMGADPSGGTRIGDLYYSFTQTGYATIIGYASTINWQELTELPESVEYNGQTRIVNKIGTYAFQSCTNLGLTSLPSGLTLIETGGFYQCSGIQIDKLPEGLTQIGTNAFRECSGLTADVVIGSGYDIGSMAFADTGIKNLVITGTPTINNTAFSTASLTDVLNLSTLEVTPTSFGFNVDEVRTDIDALGYIAPLSVYESEQVQIESPTTDILMILPLLAGVGVLMIGVGVYISRRY